MGHTILIIEDNWGNMRMVKRALEAFGYIVLEASTGNKGLEIVESSEIDLVLLDINLPDIDGYEVARRLRGSSKSKAANIPIIAITAYAFKDDAEKALSAGCNVYMSKPINIRDLWAQVEAFVPAPGPKYL